MVTCFTGETSGNHSASQYTAAQVCPQQRSAQQRSARSTIEGLSYDEAVRYLKTKYDRPRQIHQAHVKTILDAPPIKEGSGKELHDTVIL